MRSFAFLFLAASLTLAAEFSTGQAARAVIGQKLFTAQNPEISRETLGGVGGVAYANDMLVVVDSNIVGATPLNHRVLIYKNLSSMLPAPTDEVAYTARCPICVGSASVVLGQSEFTTREENRTQAGLRLPVGVATDGVRLALADRNNNRVLIWNSIPSVNGAPADVVLGQPNFTTGSAVRPPTASSLLGPQSVWIQDGRLFVADTMNYRVLIWNTFPTSHGQPADVVLGQPNFTTPISPDLIEERLDPRADTLNTPVAVTSDGIRLYVSDLGHNRVLIWNSIPTQNRQPADVVVGQPDMTSALPNNTRNLCPPAGEDDEGNEFFPIMCSATMDFPRYALSDGQRLFIADGGNDRVLVFDRIPTANGQSADAVLGQPVDTWNLASDSAVPLRRSSSDSLRSPTSLAWDGTNLYVSDPFNRRVMVFSPAERGIPYAGVRNAASFLIFAVGRVSFAGTVKANDEVTIQIMENEYEYKIAEGDTFADVIDALVAAINDGDGDPFVLATPSYPINGIILTARLPGEIGNQVEYQVFTSEGAELLVGTAGLLLTGGGDAAMIAPGTLVSIVGENFTDQTAIAPDEGNELPRELAGLEVYFDGIRSPLLYVSPTQINAQVPWEVLDTTSVNAYVRTRWSDGLVTVTNPVGVPIIPQNPGIFAMPGTDPRPGVTLHYSSFATGTVSVDGTARAGDVATVLIEDREYSYTVQQDDTLADIRDGLIAEINNDPKVRAFAAGVFTRIRLQAREPGEAGNGMEYSISGSAGAQVILTPTTPDLCCANEAGSLVTDENPALAGETIIVYATGLGLIEPEEALQQVHTGRKFEGPELNRPVEFVSSLAGGRTANVLYAGLVPGMVGVYEIHLELNSDLPTNPVTQLTIAQHVFVSNVITLPVFNPRPPEEEEEE